jgi:predicted RNase H-like HicB family nuclease
MRTLKYTFWQDGEFFLGYLNDYPDYHTQAYSKDKLLENLKDLLTDMESGEVPFVRKVEELAIAS